MLHTVCLWFSIQCYRYYLHHMYGTYEAVANNVTHLTENKYHIYNFNSAGNFKLLQLKCGLKYWQSHRTAVLNSAQYYKKLLLICV